MKKIAVITGTRAEYGLLKPVMEKINKDKELQLLLIVTGMHLSEQYGYTFHEIERDGFFIDHKVDMDLTDNTSYGISHAIGQEMIGMAKVFETEKPELIILLGDRFEIISAAVSALIFNIPIAHIHGGELTEGSIDDGIRHSVTKMSMLHFTSTPEYSKRVIQMGENPERVFCVGALGIENIKNLNLYSRKELGDKFNRCFEQPYLMITYHPVTLEKGAAQEQFANLLKGLSNLEGYAFVFTYANADAEGALINKMIEEYIKNFPDRGCAFVSMGQVGYLSALKYCTAVIGNSSSGIIEAPSFHIPTVNIGNRQAGRVAGNTVVNCGNTEKEIKEALSMALSPEFTSRCKTAKNPYDKEGTSDTIVKEIKRYLSNGNKLKKKFYDIEFDTAG